MRESALERLLATATYQAGGVLFKLDAQSRRGAPDRVVVLPGREPVFVELKTETGVVSPIQAHEHERIIKAGGQVLVLRGADAVRSFCRGE
jgi:hypothetical protein